MRHRSRRGGGDRREATLEDIAVLTGWRMIAEERSIKSEDVTSKDMGTYKWVKVARDNASIVVGAGKQGEIVARVKQLKIQIEETTSDLPSREAAGAPGQAGR